MLDSNKMTAQLKLAHWASFIEGRSESGLSVREYCEKAGVTEGSYYYWQKRLLDTACSQLLMGAGVSSIGLPTIHTSGAYLQGFAEVKVEQICPSQISSSLSEDAVYSGFLSKPDDSVSHSLHPIQHSKSQPELPVSFSPSPLKLPTSLPQAEVTPQIPSSYPYPYPQAPNQMSITIAGLSLTIDGDYPTDKLAWLLKELVRL